MKIFVDTGAFVALYNRKDQYHSSAANYYHQILGKSTFLTSNFVLAETYTLLKARGGSDLAINFGRVFRESNIFRIILVSQEIEDKAWEIFEKYSDKQFSFVDCTSFAIMQREGIKTAFSFDEHYKQFGFTIKP